MIETKITMIITMIIIKMMKNNDDSIINSQRILKLLKMLNNKKYVRDVLE